MATAGRRIHPSEDMGGRALGYGGVLQSRMSDLDTSPSHKVQSLTLEEARYSDMRKRIGLPRVPKDRISVHKDYDKKIEELTNFVRQTFQRKECKKFVPKQGQKVKKIKDLKCHCGEVLRMHEDLRGNNRGAFEGTEMSFLVPSELIKIVAKAESDPPEKLPNVPWNEEECLRKSTTNAFGKIAFNIEQIGGRKPAKYIRISDEDKAEDVLGLMEKYWRIMEPRPPNLVISVVGGAKNFKLEGRLRDTFSSGLIKAAKTTSAWLISSGFNMGVMKGVGQAVNEGQAFLWDNDRMTHLLRCIGIAPWGYIYGRHHLESPDGKGKFNAHYRSSNMILHGSPVSLNPDHTHFIFVDDGMRNRYGGVADFRAKFEKLISAPAAEGGKGIPVVLVVVEGGYDAITDASQSLKEGIPVVVCAGTGRAADILAYAYSHTFTNRNGVRDMKERHKENLAGKICDAYQKSFKDPEKDLQTYLDVVLKCCEREELIIIFHMNKHEDLDLAILSVLLKAKKSCQSGEDQRLNQLKLALTWNRADIAQEEIFREDINWNPDDLNGVLTMALEQDKVDFVKLILQQGVIMKEYLTEDRLMHLYNTVEKHSYLHVLLHQSLKKEALNLNDINKFLTKLLDKYDDEKAIMEKKTVKDKDCESETDDEGIKNFKKPYKQLLIWAILMNRVNLAKFFWEMGEECVTSALAVTRLCAGLAKQLPKYQTSLREEFLQTKKDFEQLAIKVLDECHHVDPTKAMMLVERKSPTWSNINCLQLAATASDQGFLSSVACQNAINNTWKHGLLSTWKFVLLATIFPPFIAILDVSLLGSKKISCLQKIRTFYKAPITKFTYYTFLYTVFLCLFTYMVLVDFKSSPSSVEYVCIVWVLSFFVGEIHTFLAFPYPTAWGKIRDWYGFLNRLDFFNLILVFAGFLLRWSSKYYVYAKTVYCVNVIVFFLRIMKLYTANSRLGPKLYMIMKMLEELISFIMVLAIFLLAYGVSSQGLLYPQRTPSWIIVKDILYYPYWQLYGELFLEEIESDSACHDTMANLTEVTPYNTTCRTYNWLVPILLAIYLMIGNILLLNLLIAIFSHVFDTVEKNAIEIWKYQMYYLVMEYDVKTSLFPPFSLFVHVYLLIKWIFRRTCCKKTKQGVQFEKYHLMYLQLFEKEMMSNYLRRIKSGELNSMEMKFNKLQKRVDDLTKLIEDEVIAEPPVLGETLRLVPQPPVKENTEIEWPSAKEVVKMDKRLQIEEEDKKSEEHFEEVVEEVIDKEVRHKKKKKKEKKKKKRSRSKDHVLDEIEEVKDLNIDVESTFNIKPSEMSKKLESDSSPTGERLHLPALNLPSSRDCSPARLRSVSPRSGSPHVYEPHSPIVFSHSADRKPRRRAFAMESDSDSDIDIPFQGRGSFRFVSASYHQDSDSTDENDLSKTPRTSFVSNRRLRRQERDKIDILEERLQQMEAVNQQSYQQIQTLMRSQKHK
ncbi:transient receptor potential cation channel subfamily M member 1-like isoform X2 [Gigantopelta aegis]|uniref:transient receptor potential cation channel subfamily M member 1-like isoform X2 n=1 Tax=Gigantopelta aegis TaxID=1735272 RepID=UPI001B88BC5B|nr:transient receptor potential cation channel subfamily M member 1-like isoform X2 [Gigantopelta aegis]